MAVDIMKKSEKERERKTQLNGEKITNSFAQERRGQSDDNK
jgi:hypothetical protein